VKKCFDIFGCRESWGNLLNLWKADWGQHVWGKILIEKFRGKSFKADDFLLGV
jgi:hypothetical protein